MKFMSWENEAIPLKNFLDPEVPFDPLARFGQQYVSCPPCEGPVSRDEFEKDVCRMHDIPKPFFIVCLKCKCNKCRSRFQPYDAHLCGPSEACFCIYLVHEGGATEIEWRPFSNCYKRVFLFMGVKPTMGGGGGVGVLLLFSILWPAGVDLVLLCVCMPQSPT